MLLRVLVAADPRSLAERLATVVSGLDALTRTLELDGRLVDRVSGDNYDLVVFGGPGFAEIRPAIASLRKLESPPEFIVVTEARSVEGSAAALAAGGLGVLSAELSDADLRTALAALLERARTVREAFTELELANAPEPELVVASAAMREVVDMAKRAARSASTVLLTGETGVGKERIAALVHGHSPRKDGPFVALNCAAIPAELVESELFGHERGAFTGAHQARRGYFDLAHGGTLFLDEVGELPLPVQAKLLRVLQDKQLRPVGSDRLIPLDVRLIAATNRELGAEIEAGRFRSDLYYRLRVVEIEIPPLRGRREDVRELLDSQLRYFNATLGRTILGYEAAARAALEGYGWPGNVRELINVVERAVLLCLGTEITVEDLPRMLGAGPTLSAGARPQPGLVAGPGGPAEELSVDLPKQWLELPWREVRDALLSAGERAYLAHVLAQTGGRIGLSARRAGLAERSLFEKMKRHGLRKEDFRSASETESEGSDPSDLQDPI